MGARAWCHAPSDRDPLQVSHVTYHTDTETASPASPAASLHAASNRWRAAERASRACYGQLVPLVVVRGLALRIAYAKSQDRLRSRLLRHKNTWRQRDNIPAWPKRHSSAAVENASELPNSSKPMSLSLQTPLINAITHGNTRRPSFSTRNGVVSTSAFKNRVSGCWRARCCGQGGHAQ